MTRAPFVMGKAETAFSRKAEIHDTTIGWRFVNDRIARAYGTDSMPETAENVAEAYGISREDQDAFAFRSQSRYSAAWHAADILSVTVRSGKGDAVVDRDEHPRPTTPEKLAALTAPFRAGGTVTAGNAAGINDGASAVILASATGARRHGLTPLARIGAAATAGVAPRVMGIGPVAAVERLCARTGRSADSHDIVEVNEAFAAQVLACLRLWGIPDDAPHVNAYGGGLSMGHPLGMSGARIAGTAARRLAETGGKSALVTLCVGVGQGVALELVAA
jgi:acetyl-CoA acetyltransferase family protein